VNTDSHLAVPSCVRKANVAEHWVESRDYVFTKI